MFYYSSVSYLIAEDVWMVLEDGDDKLDGLHRHVELLVQGHRHNTVLELGGEQLQLVLKTINKDELYDTQTYRYPTSLNMSTSTCTISCSEISTGWKPK
jgi:hypothetical protein